MTVAAPKLDVRSRIVAHGEEAPDQLLANPHNYRRHPAAQVAVLAGSLNDLGWVRSILVNRQTGHVVDGHARVEEALRRGLPKVPVEYVDLTPEEERLALALLDPISAMAIHDQTALDSLLAETHATDEALKKMLSEMVSPNAQVELQGDPDDAPEPPDEPITKKGDLIVMGEHRLICGDSTDALVWDRLLAGGEQGDLFWSDPPYGVNMAEKNESQAKRAGRADKHAGQEIANDDLDPAALEKFLSDVFALAFAHSRPGACWYVAGPTGPHSVSFGNALLRLGVLRATLVWVKDALVLGRSDYHSRCEFISYGWKPGAAHRALEDRTQDNVWEIPRPKKSEQHPTMKPLALVERALVNSSGRDEIVLDCFGGSGTTLLACEKVGRKARLIEIDPRYCDVIVRRWEEATGKLADRQHAEEEP